MDIYVLRLGFAEKPGNDFNDGNKFKRVAYVTTFVIHPEIFELPV